MRFQSLPLTGTLTLALTLVSASQAQVNEQNVRALTTMQSVNVIGTFVRDWCFARAPQTKAAVSAGFNGWRQDNKLDVFEKTLTGMSSEAVRSLQTSLESGRAKMYAELDKAAKNPAQECLGIRAYLNSQLNPQKMYPDAYATALSVKAAPVQTSTPKAAAPGTTAPASNVPSGKPGGPLTLGTYSCRSIRTSGGNPPRVYSLNIYGNGEWRQVIDGREIRTSVYKYDSKTGKIEISYQLNLINSEYDPEEEFAYFIKDRAGAAVIYGEDDYGLGITKTTCVYAGANKLPSPKEAAAQKARQEAAAAAARVEANRFKWVTAPGKGVQVNQIQALLYDGPSQYRDVSSSGKTPQFTLLLRDGWAYTGLRVTPHDLNVKTSRQNEPEKWFKWRQQGGKYQLFDRARNTWTGIAGKPVFAVRSADVLNKPFTNSTFSNNYSGTSYSDSSISFRSGGTFEEYGVSKSASSLSQSLYLGSSSTTSSTYSKAGCTASSASSAGNTPASAATINASATGVRDCGSDNAGKYSIDGFTLERRYESGRVNRTFIYFLDAVRKELGIGENIYGPKK